MSLPLQITMMIRAILRNAGIHPRRLISALRGWRRYVRDRENFRGKKSSAHFPWARELPILTEWDEASGGFGAYFLQDLTVARWIRHASPGKHVDIGSRIDGFVANVASFREIEVIDIRPAPGEVAGVIFHQLDVMEDLPEKWIGCTDSLSCLHTIEHFGLGRYGDPIDPDGHTKGLEQLKQMVKPGGVFYLSTPIGPERIEFNAHRVFAPETMVGWFADGWEIERCTVLDDLNRSTETAGAKALEQATCKLGVGIIMARKHPVGRTQPAPP
jgi:SAM-dependent methyltransferase